MAIVIGIDTGGTFTDAVVYDTEACAVLAKGKSRTTKEDLSLGICGALDFLPDELLHKATSIALSTTLATNACVEGKGGRAKLLLIGTPQKVLKRIDSENNYGLSEESVLCLDSHGSFDGTIIDMPDWESVIAQNEAWFADAQALSVTEAHASRNGGVVEIAAKEALLSHFDKPLIMAKDLASDLNMMERGATALLNARLLPVIEEFLHATAKALNERGVQAPIMIVRSDGGLMSEKLAFERPVETILSGPASSVHGGSQLAFCENCLIVDMGGTTTDISLVENGAPVMTSGIRIGKWRTQTSGVFIETFGLGGDSAVVVRNGVLELSKRRVEPISAALARWPHLRERLKAQAEFIHKSPRLTYQVLYLVREPLDEAHYNAKERELLEVLREGPCMLDEKDRIDIYGLDSNRLETEGIVMRCGLTPTDFMHIKGDVDLYDGEAASWAARILCALLPDMQDEASQVGMLADRVYDLVRRKLYCSIVRILMRRAYPKMFFEDDCRQVDSLIDEMWEQARCGRENPLFDLCVSMHATLIGIGAPTHIFLGDVAHMLGTDCIIPDNAEVANAVGAAVASITATVCVQVDPLFNAEALIGFRVHCQDKNIEVKERNDALDVARREAERWACAEARLRGAQGDLACTVEVQGSTTTTGWGQTLDMGTRVMATAIERSNALRDNTAPFLEKKED